MPTADLPPPPRGAAAPTGWATDRAASLAEAAAPGSRPLPGMPGAVLRPAPPPPSPIPIVVACLSIAAAVFFLLIAALFFKVAADEASKAPGFQHQIDQLWGAPGSAVPGDQHVQLERGVLYDAYLQSPKGESTSAVDISVVDARDGQPVSVAGRSSRAAFSLGGEVLTPKASFRVPASGEYDVHATGIRALAADATIKVGPDASITNGTTAGVARGLAIACIVVALAALAVAATAIVRHRRRHALHRDNLARYARTVMVAWPAPTGPSVGRPDAGLPPAAPHPVEPPT